MTTILDAVAKYGIKEALHMLHTPQNTFLGPPMESPRQYVYARKRHRSGGKGNISVYHTIQERTDKHGRQVKTYQRVDDGSFASEDDEQLVTVQKKISQDKGFSVRLRKIRIPRDERILMNSEEQSRKPVDNARRSSTVDHVRQRLLRGSSDRIEARRESTNSLLQKSNEKPTERTAHDQGRQQNSSRNEARPTKVTYGLRETCHVSRRTSRAKPRETEVLCSGGLVPTQDPSSRRPPQAFSAVRGQKLFTTRHTVRVVEESKEDGEKYGSSTGLQAPGSPFRQPKLTPQQSHAMIFGVGSQVTVRNLPRAGNIGPGAGPRARTLQSVPTEEQILLGDELQSQQQAQSHGSSSPDLQELSIDDHSIEEAFMASLDGISQTLHTPTPLSRIKHAAGTQIMRRDRQLRPAVADAFPGSNVALVECTVSHEPELFSAPGSRQADATVFGSPTTGSKSQTTRSKRFVPPATPPYTPDMSKPIRR